MKSQTGGALLAIIAAIAGSPGHAQTAPPAPTRSTQALQNSVTGEKADRIKQLGATPSDEAARSLQEVVRTDPDSSARAQAVTALSGASDTDSVRTLEESVRSDPSTSVRVASLASLAYHRDANAVRVLVEAVGPNNPLEVRTEAVRQMGMFNNPESLRILESAAKDSNWKMRMAALDAITLQPVASPGVRNAVLSLLQDPNTRVLEHASEVAGELRLREAVPVLSNYLLSGPSVSSREKSAFALGRIADPAVLAPLTQAALDSTQDVPVRAAAVHAISMIGDAGAAAQIVSLFEAKNSSLKVAAMFAFCQLQNPVADAPITKLAADPDSAVRQEVLTAMGLWPEHYARELSHAAGNKEETTENRVTAVSALALLGDDIPPEGLSALKSMLNTKGELDLQIAAVQVLGHAKGADAKSSVQAFANRSDLDQLVKTSVDEILGKQQR
jgi:HEAT repeat protein